MKIKLILSVIFLLLSSSFTPLSPALAQEATGSRLRLLRSGKDGMLLELTVDSFQVESVAYEGQAYQRVIIPDTQQTATPGAPQVPMRGALVGLPSNEGVSVQVVEASYDTLGEYRLCPASRVETSTDAQADSLVGRMHRTVAPDQQHYATAAFYPGHLVEISDTGYMRDQAVAQVQFYPVQYSPATGAVRLYRRMLVRVTWTPLLSPATNENQSASLAYENLLASTLLNYGTLERPSRSATRLVTEAPEVETKVAADDSPTATLKIGVTEDGLYELTYDDLAGAGLDLEEVDPRTLKLSNRGAEIPIYVEGEDDGRFDPGDTLLFYGVVNADIYSIENVYWLRAGGDNGRRMIMRDGAPSGTASFPSAHFPVARHLEEDTIYWQTMPHGEGQDHWFWGNRISPNTQELPTYRDYTFELDNISQKAGLTATVRVRLKGYTSLGHRTRVYLNDNEIDDQTWYGQTVYDHELTNVPHFYLQDGSNVIRVEASDSGENLPHQAFVNWIEVLYQDTYVAENDELLFGVSEPGTFQFEVTGFTTDAMRLFDVTDPTDVAMITNTTLLTNGVQFQDAAQLDSRYLALTPARYKSPTRIELDQASAWRSSSHGADYIIITHADFYTSALTLANYRNITSGMRVAVADVEDIYDEFNGGVSNPQAIRDFLSYAYHTWAAPAPTYVLLVGGATFDYRDILEFSEKYNRTIYVPTQIVETDQWGETVSDNWFVQVSGDDVLPDMFIGRLPAQTRSEADNMVNKIIGYEQTPPDESWHTNVLLVSDDDEASFETTSDQLADHLPFYYTANKVYAGDYPPGDPTADISSIVNVSGTILLNYVGHGNVDMWGTWTGGRTFDRSDVAALNNTGKLPMVTVANCYNGFFVGSLVSTSEEFMRLEDKGAISVWAPTGQGYPSGHRVLMREFYDAIFQDDQHLDGVGAATAAAKAAIYAQSSYWGELVETFLLFGDPATQLGLPVNYPYVESITPVDGARGVPVDEDIWITFNKPMSRTTVALGGSGTTWAIFNPNWNDDYTAVKYIHTDFDNGETLNFTINGQDRLGHSLGAGLVPRSWSFTVVARGEIYLPLVIRNG